MLRFESGFMLGGKNSSLQSSGLVNVNVDETFLA